LKIMNRKPVISIILILVSCVANSGFAQTGLDSLLKTSTYSDPKNIINGPRWTYVKNFSGSALLVPDYWPDADIDYDGEHYEGQTMNFDLLTDQMLVYYHEGGYKKFVVLNNDLLTGFTFTDSSTLKKYRYVCTQLPGTSFRSLYQDASGTGIRFFIRPLKKLEAGYINSGYRRVTDSYEYYLKGDSVFSRIISIKQLLNLLPGHETEMKKYVRETHFKLDFKHPGALEDLLVHYKQLR
jgi:hypothetical protein